LECPLDWDRARVSQALERASMLQAEHVRGVRCAFPDGSQRILELTVTRLEHGGRTRGWVLLGNDLTERLFLEEQLQHGSKLEAVGKLAAGIAHEINTPIQFVSDNTRFMKESASQLFSLIEVLRQVRDAAVDGTIHRDLIEQSRRIEREIEVDYLTTEVPRAIAQSLDGLGRVATIVRAMKTFAQPDATSEMAPADLNRALESTLVVAQNEIKYVADVATAFGELPLVSCHVNELNQVFLNILVNAAHAIGDVVAKTGGRGRIEVRTFCEEDSVVIAISDTGGGIPQEIRSRVFDPFFTTKEVGRGTGQGLSISRAIVVNRHGGALTVQSESGLGTTFFVRIPLNALETATAA
jgi:signal transduction histidine kinase